MARKRDDTVKLVLRLPPALHRQLTRIATRKNQSLNSEMVQRLVTSVELWPTDVAFWGSAQDYRDLKSDLARRGGTLFGGPFAAINERLDEIIAKLEARESKDDGEKK